MISHEGEATRASEAARLIARNLRPLPLRGQIQPYAWGGNRYLRELTGVDVWSDEPAAEWWLGAHPSAPSRVDLPGAECPLDALIELAPERLLGRRVVERFGPRLPFLMKVLDVRQMLSIQAHPDQAQAEAGFARENAEGLPLTASTRTYRDAQHKPETQVALTPFWMLCGFRQPDTLGPELHGRPELGPLTECFDAVAGKGGTAPEPTEVARGLFEYLMSLPQGEVDQAVDSLVRRLGARYRTGRLGRDSHDFWVVRAAEQFVRPDGHHDRGVLAIYLMNLVALAPGQGTFLGPGLLHAYLEGVAVELMASSDNVIRGGLTPKHVDVPELMRVLRFEPSVPGLLPARTLSPVERRYRVPAAEFALSRLELAGAGATYSAKATGPEVLVAISGKARLEWLDGTMAFARGAAALLPSGLDYKLSGQERALVFRAFVPEAPL